MNSDETCTSVTNFSKNTTYCCKHSLLGLRAATASYDYATWAYACISPVFSSFASIHRRLLPAAPRILLASNRRFGNCLSQVEPLYKTVAFVQLWVNYWVVNWQQKWLLATRRGSLIHMCVEELGAVCITEENI